ncbi:hypothetical protein TSO221_21780 [Azospirillum sp. TSO22-1]|nr:hypothetical protein TSO221_21780 [Azospirillum sp. TSO22-1]
MGGTPPLVPWLRPGVVMHDPAFPVDELLAGFAAEIGRRGFSVKGFVQRNNDHGRGCASRIELLDVANGHVVGIDRAVASLQRILVGDADLVVVGRFAAFERAACALGGAMREGISAGLPVLTSVAAKCMGRWHGFAGCDGALLTPDPGSLWRWWGPDRLYRDLAQGVEDGEVRRIVIGPHWLLVQGDRGVGLAHLPRGAQHLLARLKAYRRAGLRGLAGLIGSWDPVERALAVAAIGADANRPDLAAAAGNGTDIYQGAAGRVVVVGGFPGLADRLPNAQVIETNPRPGELPAAAADCLLPGCAAAILTAASLVNRTLPHMLTLAAGARVALVGPATPLTPRLHVYGIETLSGFIVRDADGIARAIAAGARPKDFSAFGRFVHMRAPSTP